MANSSLTRTVTASSATSYTVSFWLKLSNPNYSGFPYIWSIGSTAGNGIFFDDNDRKIKYFKQSTSGFLSLYDGVLRDPSAWYHIVWSVSSGTGTGYINGITGNSHSSIPALNDNTGTKISIHDYVGGGYNSLDCLIANFHFIDGQALTPSSFGETDATTGIWKPKAYSGSYGTNGFFLKFENSGSLGTDSSGNGNNFTVNGTPTQTVDTPSNVFCTLNAIQNGNGTTSTLINGNLTATGTDNRGVAGTLGVNKGKWYWELKNSGTQYLQRHGVTNRANEQDGDAGDPANTRSYVGQNFYKNYYTTSSVSNASFINTNGTIYGVALDLDNGTLGRYVNGTLIHTDTTLPSDNSVTFFPFTFVTFSGGGGWNQAQFNFGNGVFGTTAISSPYSDGAGLGKFQYQPPTGYYALCTKNINVYG